MQESKNDFESNNIDDRVLTSLFQMILNHNG